MCSGCIKSKSCSFEASIKDLAKIWVEPNSAEAANLNNSFSSTSVSLAGTISSTAKVPLVIVPVLSKAIDVVLLNFSKVLPERTITPLALALLIPEINAIGADRINGHGEAKTIT